MTSSFSKSPLFLIIFFLYFMAFLRIPADQFCSLNYYLSCGYVITCLSFKKEIYWPEVTLVSAINLLFKLTSGYFQEAMI